jgi:cytochrome c-type biogenesis protein CcmH
MRRCFDRLLSLAAAAVVASFVAAACDSHIEPYVEGETPRHPDVERILPDTGARSPAPRVQVSAASSEASIRGRIEVAPELASLSPERAVLYLMARPSGAGPGPPVAVKRLEATSFPVAFEIGSENMMAPDLSFEGSFHLSARLDMDGEAITKRPGDLVGAAQGATHTGSSDVVIVLDHKL